LLDWVSRGFPSNSFGSQVFSELGEDVYNFIGNQTKDELRRLEKKYYPTYRAQIENTCMNYSLY
jgi:hypothetical protein